VSAPGQGPHAVQSAALLVVWFVLAAGSGCGGDGPGGAARGLGTLSDIEPLSTELVARLGDPASGGEGFTGIAGVDVDDAGLLYVLDAGGLTIRVHDADLREVRRIGGRGQGPGEFQMRSPLGAERRAPSPRYARPSPAILRSSRRCRNLRA
jgi:hypothetical protein